MAGAPQGYIGRNPSDGRTAINRQTFNVTTGVQTSFTFTTGYDLGYLEVYLNGIKQNETTDYTAADGSTFSFAVSTPTVQGDTVEAIAYKSFNTTNVTGSIRDFNVGRNLDVSGNVTIGSSLTIASDLVVNGTYTYVNTEILDIEDKTVGIASTSSPSNTTADGAGIVVYGGSDGDKSLTWNKDKANWVLVGGGVSIGTGCTISSSSANVLEFSVDGAVNAKLNNYGAFIVGDGVAGEAWQNDYKTVQAGSGGFGGNAPAANAASYWTNNAYFDAVNSRWEYIAADEASRFEQGNGALAYYNASSGSADGAITWSERLRITSAGKVGIGDADPDEVLHVYAAGAAIKVDSNGDSAVRWATSGTNKYSLYHNNGANALIFYDNGNSAERLRITAAGDVGIGTIAPVNTGAGATTGNTATLAVGIITCHKIYGDGSELSNIVSTTINNNADNRLITGSGTANTLNGEANLTYDGDSISQAIDANAEGINIKATGNFYPQLSFNSNRSSNNNTLGYIPALWNNTEVASISFNAGDDTTNKDNASIRFNTASAGTNTERMRITTAGSLLLGTATSNASDRFTLYDSGSAFMSIRSDSHADGNSQVLDFAVGTSNRASGNLTASIEGDIHSTSGGTLKGDLVFYTNRGDNLLASMRIKDTGRVLIGGQTDNSNAGGFENALQVEGTSATSSSISVIRNSNDENPPYINFGKSRGTSVNSNTAVADNDLLGQLDWTGADGSGAFNNFAVIKAYVDGTPGNSDAPGRLVFFTTPDGSTSPTERLRITSTGSIHTGGTTTATGTFTVKNINDSSHNVLECLNDNGNVVSGFSQASDGDGSFFAKLNDGTLTHSFRSDNVSYINNTQSFIMGASSGINNCKYGGSGTFGPRYQMLSNASSFGHGLGIFNFRDGSGNPAIPAIVRMGLSRNDTTGSNGIVLNNDTVATVEFMGNDGTQFVDCVRIDAQVDGTPGTNDMPGRLVILTTSDGGSTVTERLRITSTGELRFASGTRASNTNSICASNGNSIDLNGSEYLYFRTNNSEVARFNTSGSLMIGTTSDGTGVNLDEGGFINSYGRCVMRRDDTMYIAKSLATGGYTAFEIRSAQTTVGSISFNSGGTSYNTSSDYRRKENIVNLTDGITRLKTLKPYRFNFKNEPDVTRDGFLAHEVTAVPEAVWGTKDAVEPKDDEEKDVKKDDPIYQQLDQSKLVPLLTAALQEAITKIETLETKVAALESA